MNLFWCALCVSMALSSLLCVCSSFFSQTLIFSYLFYLHFRPPLASCLRLCVRLCVSLPLRSFLSLSLPPPSAWLGSNRHRVRRCCCTRVYNTPRSVYLPPSGIPCKFSSLQALVLVSKNLTESPKPTPVLLEFHYNPFYYCW